MTEKTTGNETGIWETVVSLRGRAFYTAKGLPFVYAVKGGELFVDRRKRSVTRSTFERAFEKMRSDPTVRGPKKLGVYGAPLCVRRPQSRHGRHGKAPRLPRSGKRKNKTAAENNEQTATKSVPFRVRIFFRALVRPALTNRGGCVIIKQQNDRTGTLPPRSVAFPRADFFGREEEDG